MEKGAIVIGFEQTWTLWKEKFDINNFYVEDFSSSSMRNSRPKIDALKVANASNLDLFSLIG
ncbi:hypothetical protein PIB30_062955, partial [Stylosanthes scabra]|nr:hypothetical protein [Stylosanthes scabra]